MTTADERAVYFKTVLAELINRCEEQVANDRASLEKLDEAKEQLESEEKVVQALVDEVDAVDKEIQSIVDEAKAGIPLKSELDELLTAVSYASYTAILSDVVERSKVIKSFLAAEEWQGASEAFFQLRNKCNEFQNSSCANLVHWLFSVVAYWKGAFKVVAASVVSETVEKLGWAHFEHELVSKEAVLENQELLSKCRLILRNFDHPDDLELVAKLLAHPFCKRFVFFFGQANRPESSEWEVKPEHYLSVALKWFSNSAQWIHRLVDNGRLNISPEALFYSFGRALVKLCCHRLRADLLLNLEDESEPIAFASFVDEVVAFDTDMIACGYPETEDGCMQIFEDDQFFSRWHNLEQRELRDYMMSLFVRPDAWAPRFVSISEQDNLKVPYCVDRFLAALAAFTKRLSLIRSLEKRIQMTHLQRSLIDEFLNGMEFCVDRADRLDDAPYFEVANAASYVSLVLQDWQDQWLYMKLEVGIFDSHVTLFDNFANSLLSAHACAKGKALVNQFSAILLPMVEERKTDLFNNVLAKHLALPTRAILEESRRALSNDNYCRWLGVFVEQCENGLIENLIFKIHCDQSVGSQLQMAFVGYFALFQQGWTVGLVKDMRRFVQCLLLLSSNVSMCLLLKEHVHLFGQENGNRQHWDQVLEEVNLRHLDVEAVKRIVANRTDL